MEVYHGIGITLSRATSRTLLHVEQLGVRVGSQQRLHARLVPSESGLHQGVVAAVVLQVRVGRVLQEDEHDGGVATMSEVPPPPLGRSMLALRFSSSLTNSRWPLTAAACSRP